MPQEGIAATANVSTRENSLPVKPLHGIRILDLSHSLAGPFASMLLANLGAEVIKVEPPEGDETRTWAPHVGGESSYFIAANRGLKSISIDLKREEGRTIVHELAPSCDVVIENFRLGVAERLGVDYHEICKHNPTVIYCSIKGFGATSPYSSKAAYDIIIQAMSGLMGTTGEEGRPPVRVSFALFDIMAGMFSTIYVLAALHGNEKPSYIEVSLFDTAVFAMSYVPMAYLLTGKRPLKMGSAHPSMVPYQAFRDQDGRYFIVAAANDRLWKSMCQILNETKLVADARFRTNQDRVKNREQLIAALQEKFAMKSREDWIKLLEEAGVPVGPVNEIDEVFKDPNIKNSGIVTELIHKTLGAIPYLQPPVWVNGQRFGSTNPSPILGEHTTQILRELGYSEKTISLLRDNGTIG